MCVSEASTAREIGAPGAGCMRMGMEERMSQARGKLHPGLESNPTVYQALEVVSEGGQD